MGFLGVFLIMLLAFVCSNNKRTINWRTVGGSFLLLVASALVVFVFPWGVKAVALASNAAGTIVMEGQHGAQFLFGGLIKNQGFIFAVTIVTNTLYLGALFALLYYLRIMPLFNNVVAFLLCKFLRISKVEALTTTYAIFLGSGETYLAVKPLFHDLNRSQIFTILVASMACASGTVMGGYIAMGIPANHVLGALMMTIPSSILIGKLMYPQDELVIEANDQVDQDLYHGFLDAIGVGTYHGFKLGVTICIMVASFVSLIALTNYVLVHLGGIVHIHHLTLQQILGYVFAPVAYLLGVPHQDIMQAGSIIATKTITNEFVGFTQYIKVQGNLAEKTRIIVVFVLCGFANLGTLGIIIGAIKSLVPQHAKVFCNLGFKALFAAILVNLLNGAIAGLAYSIHPLH